MGNERPFWTSTLQELSIDIKNSLRRGDLTPQIVFWIFGSPRGLHFPTFGSVNCILTLSPKVGLRHFRSLESNMPIFLANWTPRITSWAPVSRSTILGVYPSTWITNRVLSTMTIPVAMEALSLGTTFKNEWETLWREWLSTTLLLSNKSISEVFLTPFWYVNVESEVGKPTSLAMLEQVTRLQMPSTTHELIECLSKVLDGTSVACGLGISRGPDVMFRVSSSTVIMSLVLSFKSWKLNNGVLTSFYATSCIWSWYSISWSMENCVFS